MRHLTLDEMKTVRLMNRVDTKFVTHQQRLLSILALACEKGYQVQCTAGPINGYDSTYYDTSDWAMFTMHHNRKLHRYKIRSRTYLDSKVSFLEIKDKNNKGRTSKKREKVNSTDPAVLQSDYGLEYFVKLYTGFDFPRLLPTLQTKFHRITLVNSQKTERITVDIGVNFKNVRTGQTAALDNLVIIELKQDGRYPSTMRAILNQLRIKPFHISKYCMGVALTYPNAKKNRFKRKLHLLNKIKSTL